MYGLIALSRVEASDRFSIVAPFDVATQLVGVEGKRSIGSRHGGVSMLLLQKPEKQDQMQSESS